MSNRAPTIATRKMPNGAAIAAYISAMIGLLTLSLSALLSEVFESFKEWVQSVGKLWMPGAEGIGPYSGKETLGLVAWLVTWVLLHALFRKKELSGGFWLVLFLVGIGIATTLVWPPFWHLIGA